MRAPQPGKFSPKGSKPGSSKGSKPGSPAGRKPSGLKTEKPIKSDDKKPGKFQTEKPAYAEGRKPASNYSKFAPKGPRRVAPKHKDESEGIRLNKYIANSGVCSRREADIYIQSGNVKVNQTVVNELGYKVMPGDQVFFDGSKVNPEKPLYILLNKPKNFSTAGSETGATRQVMELIKLPGQSSATPLGRMDKNTTGLLLITNDTILHQKYALPSPRAAKIYQVSLDKNLKYEDLETIEKGLIIEGHRVNVDEISYIDGEAKSEIGIKLKSTNIRIVRSIFEHFNYDVLRVDRVMLAGLTKKNLARGQWRELDQQEIINLKNMF